MKKSSTNCLKRFIHIYYLYSVAMKSEMCVEKRNGELETVSFDKILNRIKALGYKIKPALENINYTELVMKVIDQMYDGITTTKLDELSSQQAASMSTTHNDYGVLAGRI